MSHDWENLNNQLFLGGFLYVNCNQVLQLNQKLKQKLKNFNCKNDFNICRALAWSACNKLHLIWKSNISKDTKLAFFRASVESTLRCWDLDHEERSWKTFRWCVYKATYKRTKLILERWSHSGWHIWKHNSHLKKTGAMTTQICWPLFS